MNSENDKFVARREKVKSQFTTADTPFKQAAERHNMTFCDRAGPSIGRALRRTDSLERGIFLELNERWMDTNPDDPAVVFALMVRHKPNNADFPIFILSRTYFTGSLSQVTGLRLESLLEQACVDVEKITLEEVLKDGKRYDDFPKEKK